MSIDTGGEKPVLSLNSETGTITNELTPSTTNELTSSTTSLPTLDREFSVHEPSVNADCYRENIKNNGINGTSTSTNNNNDVGPNSRRSTSLRAISPERSASPSKGRDSSIHTAYSKRVGQKPLQYLETWQHRNSLANQSPTPARRNSVTNTPRKLPSVEKREKIARLTEQNDDLTREVRMLSKEKNDLRARVSQLEDDLNAVMAKTEELMNENTELNAQVDSTKIEISAKETMLLSLAKEKCLIESEKQHLQDDKAFFENQLLDMNKKLRETSKRADEAEAAVAAVVQQIDKLNKNLQSMSKNDPTAEVQEIVKQMELTSIQACKDMLKKELKKLSGSVQKARDEAAEAKQVIEDCRVEEGRYRAEVSRLEKAIKSANEYSQRLEKQEKMLKSNIELLEARLKSLEVELNSVRAERDAKEAAAGGLDSIRTSIQILEENAKQGHEHLQALSEQMPELIQDRSRSEEAGKALLLKAEQLTERSNREANAAEEKLSKLKQEVEALDAALEQAKVAAEDSESKAWEMISELTASGSSSSIKLDLPAATTYLLGLGLFVYSVYISNHA